MEPIILITTYPNKSRALRYFIVEMLKKWFATSVDRLNYAKSYTIKDSQIDRQEQKILIIKTSLEKKESLEKFIKSKLPEQNITMFYIDSQNIIL